MVKSEIVIHEYQTVRAEINNSFGSSKKILIIGLTTIAAIFTSGVLNQLNNMGSGAAGPLQPSLAILALILAIPLVSLVVFAIWLGEYQRIQRAGTYLIDFEKRVNRYFGSNNELLLNWENYLEDKSLHMDYPYKAVMAFMVCLHLFSHVGGALIINQVTSYKWFVVQAAFFIFQGIGFGYLFLKYKSVLQKLDKVRNKIKKSDSKKGK